MAKGGKTSGNTKLKIALEGAKKAKQELEALKQEFKQLEDVSKESSKAQVSEINKLIKKIEKLEALKKKTESNRKKATSNTKKQANQNKATMQAMAREMSGLRKATQENRKDFNMLANILLEVRDSMKQVAGATSEMAADMRDVADSTAEATQAIDDQTDAYKGLAKQQQKTGRGGGATKATEAGSRGGGAGTRGFSSMAKGAGVFTAAYAVIAANVFAITQAFNQLAQGEALLRLEANLASIGTHARPITATAIAMQELTDGALSYENALRQSARASAYGFNSDEIKEMTVAARKASVALGINMADALDRLIRGIQKQEVEVLDELGIVTRLIPAIDKYAAELGKNADELTDLERRQALYNESLRQAEVQYGNVSTAAGELERMAAATATSIELLRAKFASWSQTFLEFTGIADGLENFAMQTQMDALTRSIERNQEVLAEGRANNTLDLSEEFALVAAIAEEEQKLLSLRQTGTDISVEDARKRIDALKEERIASQQIIDDTSESVKQSASVERISDTAASLTGWTTLRDGVEELMSTEASRLVDAQETAYIAAQDRVEAIDAEIASMQEYVAASAYYQSTVESLTESQTKYWEEVNNLGRNLRSEPFRAISDDYLSEAEKNILATNSWILSLQTMDDFIEQSSGAEMERALEQRGEFLSAMGGQLSDALTKDTLMGMGFGALDLSESGGLLEGVEVTRAQLEAMRDVLSRNATETRLLQHELAKLSLSEQVINATNTGAESFEGTARGDAIYSNGREAAELESQLRILTREYEFLNAKRGEVTLEESERQRLELLEKELELLRERQRLNEEQERSILASQSRGVGVGGGVNSLYRNETLGGTFDTAEKQGLGSDAFNDRQANAALQLANTLQGIDPVMGQLSQGMYDFGQSTLTMFEEMSNGGLNFQTTMAGVSQGIQAVSSIAQASSQQAVNDIDFQIAMEKKRDGKSAESQKKIAALERKKIKEQQKMKLQQAIMATAAGIAESLSMGPPGIPFAAIIGAMGMMQIQAIKKKGAQDLALSSTQAGGDPLSLEVGKLDRSVDVSSSASGSELDNLRGFKPGRAAGGTILPGHSYVTGENGPEVVTPKVPMEVSSAGSGVSSTNNTNITLSPVINAIDASDLAQRIDGISESLMGSLEKELNNRGISLNDLRF